MYENLLKVIVVLDNGVAQLDAHRTALFKHLFQQYRLQQWVQLFVDIFQQHGQPKLNRILQHPRIIGLGETYDAEPIGLFHVLDPLIGLTLRINHQRPASSVSKKQRIFVCPQFLNYTQNGLT